jgi:hypothetical protein
MDLSSYRSHPALNFSSAKALLQSPAHFKAGKKTEETPAMASGTLVHAYALQGIKLPYVVRPDTCPETGENWHGQRKGCRAWMEAQSLAGIPVFTAEEIEDQAGMVAALEASPEFQAISKLCPIRERPAFATYRGVEIKALFDMEGADASGVPMICDLKTTISGSPRDFARSAAKFSYFLQLAWYSTVMALEKGLEQKPGFLWVTVESSAPYNVTLYSPPDEGWDFGMRQMDKCIDLYLQCKETGIYPGYGSGIQQLPWLPWIDRDDAA